MMKILSMDGKKGIAVIQFNSEEISHILGALYDADKISKRYHNTLCKLHYGLVDSVLPDHPDKDGHKIEGGRNYKQ